ncbi:hypothetical protein YPPY61_1441, partial [Yersinia pestis PY-61]
MWRPASTATSR